ncbi:MAG TPA: hypothetical protein H9752_10070 [Candidatus Phocaeicola excrementigallinarum]|nr:hypothetical protein [Candidatus Phocaeicola excrementigallinarum]
MKIHNPSTTRINTLHETPDREFADDIRSFLNHTDVSFRLYRIHGTN